MALFLIGILIAAAIAVPIVLIMLGGDDDTTAGSSTSTSTATSTSGGTSTTAGNSTTSSSTSTSTSSSTTSSSTTSSTTSTTSSTTTTTSGALELDSSLEAFYEEFDLVTGFLPDPWEAEAQAGGSIDVSYLGGGCRGFASEPPDFQVTYTGGDSSLRFYFVADTAGADTTLIVNDPTGEWVCGDDSYGGSNPTVDFLGVAPDGIYDVWIGSYTQGDFHSGTFYITELDANHP